MDIALVGVRLLLALVFAAAAVGKLRDRRAFGVTLIDFGVPGAVARVLAVLLPVAELGTAALLVPAAAASWGAVSALVLLAAFTAAVGVTLARGRTPECRCFGALAIAPIGPATLARNVVLGLAAGLLIVAGPGVGIRAIAGWWRSADRAARLVASGSWVLMAALSALAWSVGNLLARQHALLSKVDALEKQLTDVLAAAREGAVTLRSLGLPIGTPAPPFDLPKLEGDRASLSSLERPGLPVLLIFSSAHCPACSKLWPEVARWQRELAGRMTIAAICSGPDQVIEAKLFGLEVHNVLLADTAALGDAYQVPGLPAALVLHPDGRVATETAMGIPAIRDLVKAHR